MQVSSASLGILVQLLCGSRLAQLAQVLGKVGGGGQGAGMVLAQDAAQAGQRVLRQFPCGSRLPQLAQDVGTTSRWSENNRTCTHALVSV